MPMPGPKPTVSLQEWMPRTLDEARELYALLVDKGDVSVSTARSFVGRLQTIRLEGPLTKRDSVERSQLRRVLAGLGEPPWTARRAAGEADLRPLSSVRLEKRPAPLKLNRPAPLKQAKMKPRARAA